ncbi:hypothetical protein A1353_07705 [Methylomonas methanica]|uniref:DUF1993 domain-containing protein n=2 Tax=Methylococcaceae TaxID=403 RepID=A0A177MNJ8_METMH|nr:DUF1993 domain-containing protein [Methylomonas sp. ZR1]OAI07231.1 hypothetical protein A1353_07705 [Methylomonas methanica]OAI08326.1 hypothetical protein A1332_07505 [Methylomonas methanica]
MLKGGHMYYQILSQCIHSLTQIEAWLDKAEQYATDKKFDVNILMHSRLAPDMKDFIYQVTSACDYVKAGSARLTGQTPPKHEDTEQTIEEARDRIKKTITFAESVKEVQFERAGEHMITVSWQPGKLIRGEDYLLQIIIPNFFFHLTTAYNILRHNGVEIGKMDYLGSMNFVEITR